MSLLVPAETVAELLTHQRVLDEAASAARGHASTLDGAATLADDGRSAGDVRAPGDRLCALIALPWGTVAPATLEDGTPVPMTELARALCEADITRIVMSAESLPLDVGRTKRL
ncbi:hypothetical protein HP550_00080, partial [Cellulomonas humilata]|nr:hypothetical protein [Cellulomonas humilata]